MTIRTTCRTVTFTRPFRLRGVAKEQPAGIYIVETDEGPLEAASIRAYRCSSTLIRLPGEPSSAMLGQVVDIDPTELADALARDAAASS
jgi:hypothetical protein